MNQVSLITATPSATLPADKNTTIDHSKISSTDHKDLSDGTPINTELVTVQDIPCDDRTNESDVIDVVSVSQENTDTSEQDSSFDKLLGGELGMGDSSIESEEGGVARGEGEGGREEGRNEEMKTKERRKPPSASKRSVMVLYTVKITSNLTLASTRKSLANTWNIHASAQTLHCNNTGIILVHVKCTLAITSTFAREYVLRSCEHSLHHHELCMSER